MLFRLALVYLVVYSGICSGIFRNTSWRPVLQQCVLYRICRVGGRRKVGWGQCVGVSSVSARLICIFDLCELICSNGTEYIQGTMRVIAFDFLIFVCGL